VHKYLRAVGFSALEKTVDLNILLNEVIKNYDCKKVVCTEKGMMFAEFSKDFAADCGIAVCGEYNEEGDFHIGYHFPYVIGSAVSSSEDVIIERRADNEAYIGACDDMRLDISLIFHLINAADYLNSEKPGNQEARSSAVTLSALCTDGKILLPVLRSEEAAKEKQKKLQKRSALIMAAKNGDEDAMESLTVDDMDIYNEISKRIGNEDVYSIVDNCFMPYGFGSDMYSVIGDIKEFSREQNRFTGENLIKMSIICNDINLDVCINEKDLLGEPAVGRRFKGVIWLQGTVEF
jgi:hypothetical protein